MRALFLLTHEGTGTDDEWFLPMGVFDTPELAMEFVGDDREWHVTRNDNYDDYTLYDSIVSEYNIRAIAHNPTKQAPKDFR